MDMFDVVKAGLGGMSGSGGGQTALHPLRRRADGHVGHGAAVARAACRVLDPHAQPIGFSRGGRAGRRQRRHPERPVVERRGLAGQPEHAQAVGAVRGEGVNRAFANWTVRRSK